MRKLDDNNSLGCLAVILKCAALSLLSALGMVDVNGLLSLLNSTLFFSYRDLALYVHSWCNIDNMRAV